MRKPTASSILVTSVLIGMLMSPILSSQLVHGDGDQPVAVLAIDKVYDSTRAGETVLIKVTLINVTGCSGWNIKLAWDPHIAAASNLIEGPFFRESGQRLIFSTASLDNDKGEVVVAEMFLDRGNCVSGTGVIFTVNFTMLNVGTTPISFRPISSYHNGSVLSDATNTHILDVVEINGLLTVKAPRIEPARFYVDPERIIDETLLPGISFNVSIKVDKIPMERGLSSVQFSLVWEPALLDALDLTETLFHESTPETEWDNIQNSSLVVDNAGGYLEYSQCFYDLSRAVENGYAPIFGNHTVATITFQVKSVGKCSLSVANLFLSFHNLTSGQIEPVPREKSDGFFCNSPPPKPFVFRINPMRIVSERMLPGKTFYVSINLDSLDASANFVGVQFELTWDPSVLEAVNMTEVMFHEVTPESEWDNIWNISSEINNTGGFLVYAFAFLNIYSAGSKGYSPIRGNHTLATVAFKVKGTGQSSLHLKDFVLGDEAANSLWSIAVDGHFKNVITVDLDGDNSVDIMDAIAISKVFGCCLGDQDWNPKADFDENNVVDILDVIILAAKFGHLR